MTLHEACELLVRARQKANAVDLWRAIGLIEQALANENIANENIADENIADENIADENIADENTNHE